MITTRWEVEIDDPAITRVGRAATTQIISRATETTAENSSLREPLPTITIRVATLTHIREEITISPAQITAVEITTLVGMEAIDTPMEEAMETPPTVALAEVVTLITEATNLDTMIDVETRDLDMTGTTNHLQEMIN